MLPPLLLAAAQANPGPPPAWLFLAFPILWFAVGSFLGRASGHHALLARFPPVDERLEASFNWASGKLRWIDYNSALHVGIGARGLHLAANSLFRPVFARGIPCIPWQEVRLVRPRGEGFLARFRGSHFEVRAIGLPFRLYGRAALAVEKKLAAGPGITVH